MLHEMIWVNLKEGSYPIIIGENLFTDPDILHKLSPFSRGFILTSRSIAPLHLFKLKACCERFGVQVDDYVLPDGETQKNLSNFEKICTFLMEHHHNRESVLFALGGGVIGDLAGFVAASYMRGVRFVQCPTSLLAAVDASVGGKTGVDHKLGKNLIGAFHQPTLVLIDLDLLSTLPDVEWRSGLAEIIKYGVSLDANFFEWLERHIDALLKRDKTAVLHAITQSCRLKAEIVSEDVTEKGKRRVLNFGHTIGHALEAIMGYQGLRHGEAVSIGMMAATRLSERLGLCDKAVGSRLLDLLTKSGLPTAILEDIPVSSICEGILQDKKFQNDKLRWILLNSLGHCTVEYIPELSDIKEVLMSLGAKPTP